MNRPETQPNGLWALLLTSPPFDSFTDELKSELVGIAIPLDFTTGQTVLNQDEPSPGMFLIESGTVKVSRFNHNGREYILTILERGRTFNDITVWDQGANPTSVIAQTDCRIWCLPCDALLDIVNCHPTLIRTLAATIAEHSRHLVRELDGLSLCTVKARLARYLLSQPATNNQLNMPLTQEEIASRLGTVREMVSRNLNKLQKEGCIHIQSQRITILNRNQLLAVAEL